MQAAQPCTATLRDRTLFQSLPRYRYRPRSQCSRGRHRVLDLDMVSSACAMDGGLSGRICPGICPHVKVSNNAAVPEDVKYQRLQKRLIHRIGQMAERNLDNVLKARMPSLRKEDQLHPCTKQLV